MEGRHPSKVVFRQRSSSVKGGLLLKVVFRQSRLLSKVVFLFWVIFIFVQHCVPSSNVQVIFCQRSSSVKGRLPSKVVFLFWVIFIFVQRRVPSSNVQVVFCQRSSTVKGRLPLKVVFCQRSPSVKSCLPSKVVFYQGPLSLLGHFHFWVLVLSVA